MGSSPKGLIPIFGRESTASQVMICNGYNMVCAIMSGGGSLMAAGQEIVGSIPALDFFPLIFLFPFFSLLCFSPPFPLSHMLAPPLQCSSIFLVTCMWI